MSLTLPQGANSEFITFREKWLRTLPLSLRTSIILQPEPHITLFYDCNGDKNTCLSAISNLPQSKHPLYSKFAHTKDIIVNHSQSVVLLPIICTDLVNAFTTLYYNINVNPQGTKCKMFLSSKHITTNNVLGYTPHVTLAWFKQGTDLSTIENSNFNFKTASFALSLSPENVTFEALSRPEKTNDRNIE